MNYGPAKLRKSETGLGARARLLIEPLLDIRPAVAAVPTNLRPARTSAEMSPLVERPRRYPEVLRNLGRRPQRLVFLHGVLQSFSIMAIDIAMIEN